MRYCCKLIQIPIRAWFSSPFHTWNMAQFLSLSHCFVNKTEPKDLNSFCAFLKENRMRKFQNMLFEHPWTASSPISCLSGLLGLEFRWAQTCSPYKKKKKKIRLHTDQADMVLLIRSCTSVKSIFSCLPLGFCSSEEPLLISLLHICPKKRCYTRLLAKNHMKTSDEEKKGVNAEEWGNKCSQELPASVYYFLNNINDLSLSL